MDAPPPNIPLSACEALRRAPRVEAAVPVAMGDAYQGFRYVATSEAYFAPFPWRRHAPALSTGRLFPSEAPDRPDYGAVLGPAGAPRAALKASDPLSQGGEMAAHRLPVVGARPAP